MLIDHDTRRALGFVVDLLNTATEGEGGLCAARPAGNSRRERSGESDGLLDIAALRHFAERNRIGNADALGERDLAAVWSVRARFAEVFAAADTRSAVEVLNAMAAAAGTTPRLTDHDGHDWHVHYVAPGASLADRLAADGGMAIAALVVAGERERLRRCEAPDCRRAFVDLSRNRSRRYCDSRTCGNRIHVAAYRARRREAAGQREPASSRAPGR